MTGAERVSSVDAIGLAVSCRACSRRGPSRRGRRSAPRRTFRAAAMTSRVVGRGDEVRRPDDLPVAGAEREHRRTRPSAPARRGRSSGRAARAGRPARDGRVGRLADAFARRGRRVRRGRRPRPGRSARGRGGVSSRDPPSVGRSGPAAAGGGGGSTPRSERARRSPTMIPLTSSDEPP